MVKTLTSVGNSKALILPKRLIDKYGLNEVTIKETAKGLLILPARDSFEEKLLALKQQKEQVYARIKTQAEDPETIAYYNSPDALDDIDLEIIEE